MSFFEGFSKKIRSTVQWNAGSVGFLGALFPGLLSGFGMITFIKVPHLIAVYGGNLFLFVLLIGTMINLFTALSISSIVSNFNLKSGGVYALLSRSFGAKLGIATSVPLYISLAVNIAFCLIGIREIFFPGIDPKWHMLIGSFFIVFFFLFTVLPKKWYLAFQCFIFALLTVAFYFIVQSHPNRIELSASSAHPPFWTLFALFFPAITGFESVLFQLDQINKPKKILPYAILSIVIGTFFIYLGLGKFFSHYIDGHVNLSLLQTTNPSWVLYSLIFCLTVVYAVNSLINAPKLFYAMLKEAQNPDSIFRQFSEKTQVFFVSFFTICLVFFFYSFFDLDLLTPLLTHFFLLTYAILNLSCFIESFIRNPSWRPNFFVHFIYPLFGFVLTLIAMFMMDSFLTLASFFGVFVLYLIIQFKEVNQNFDDIRQSLLLYLTRFATYRLIDYRENSFRSWRPQLICFSQNLTQMTPGMRLAKALTQDKGFLVIASSLKKEIEDKIPHLKTIIGDFFFKNRMQAIVELFAGIPIDELIQRMASGYGIGPIKPNTLLFSYHLDKGSFYPFSSWMKVVQEQEKNGLILCFKERPTKVRVRSTFLMKNSVRKKIVILIEKESKTQQFFLFLITALLCQSEEFFQADVLVVVKTAHEGGIKPIEEYYQDFFLEHRFYFSVEVQRVETRVEREADLFILSYSEQFSNQIELAHQIANLGADVLLVYSCQTLAFDPDID